MKLILASASSGRRQLLASLKIPFEVMESNIDEEKIVDSDPVKMAVKRAKAKACAVAAQILNYVETRHGASNTENHHAVKVANSELKIKRDGKTHNSASLQKNNGETILVIGADTVGFLGSWIFGKPKSRKEAEAMLRRLSGKTHLYVSAHCVVKIENHISLLCNERTMSAQSKRSLLKNNSWSHTRPSERAACPVANAIGVCVHYEDFDIASVTLRKLSAADIKFYLDRVPFTALCGAIQIMGSPQNFVIATHGSLSTIIGLCLEKLVPRLFPLDKSP